MTRYIQGSGGGGKSGSSSTPTEAANTLFSNSQGGVVDLLSEGEIEGFVDDRKSVFYNETALEDGTGNVNFPGVSVEANWGTEDQPALAGFDNVRTSVSVAQDLPYNVYKTISFPNGGAVTAVDITISADQFFQVQKDGNIVGTSVTFVIERSQNGGSFEEVINATLSGKQNDTYDTDYRIPVTNTAGNTSIRVKRTKVDATDLNIHDTISFKIYTKIVEHKLVYPNRAVVGHHFDAKQFGNQLPSRAYKIRGIKCSVPHNYDPVKRTYTGSFTGALSGTKQWTNNPAWVLYDMITSKRYGLGQFLDSSLIDIPSLYTLGKWCDEFVSDCVSSALSVSSLTSASGTATVTSTNHGYATGNYIQIAGATPSDYNGTFYVTVTGANTFTYTVAGSPTSPATGTITCQKREPRWVCNAYITDRADAFNVLKEIASCFRGVMFWMDGKLWAQADLPRDPVKLVTNANVIDGNFTYSGESNRSRNSVVNVAWNDPDIFYRRAIETYEDPDLIRELSWRATDVQAVGCTSRAQARRLAKAILYAQEFESELVTYRASFDHMAVDGDGPVGIAPGDVVLISDYARGNAVAGGRVTTVISSSVFAMVDSTAETISEDVVDTDGTPIIDTDGTPIVDGATTAEPIDWGSGTGTVWLEHAATGDVEWVACTYSDNQITMTATPAEAVAVNDLFILVDAGFDPEPFRVIKISEVERNILEIAAARYNEGKFNAIYGEDKFDTTNVMRVTVGSFIAAPTALTVAEHYITSPDFNTRTLELSWTGVSDPYLDFYEITYSLNNSPPLRLISGSTTATLPQITPGVYHIDVRAVNRVGIRSQALSTDFTVNLTPADYPAGTTASLVLQSGGTSFVGKDAAFAWQVVSPTATYITAAGGTAATTGFTDPKFRDCVVYVKTTGGTLLRTESIVDTHYAYTYEKNHADNAGVPLRSFKVEVTYRDIFGRESAPVSLTVSNPAPAVSSVVATPTDNQLTLAFSPNTDPDFVGTIVWMSTSAGFTPGSGNKVWQAAGNAIIPVSPNVTYYYRYAGYDVFGTTGLTTSSEQTVSTGVGSVYVDGPVLLTTFKYDYTGVAEGGEFPRDLTFKLLDMAGTQVTSGITWTYNIITGGVNSFTSASGAQSMSGAGTGTLTVTSLDTSNCTLQVTATMGSTVSKKTITLSQEIAAPPVTTPGGGGGSTGTVASKSSGFTGPSNTTFIDASGAITGAPATTSVNVNVSLSCMPTSGSNGSWTVECKVMRDISGTPTQIGTTQSAPSDWHTVVDSGRDPADFLFSINDTGLTAGTSYTWRIYLRVSAGGTRIHSATGSVTVTT